MAKKKGYSFPEFLYVVRCYEHDGNSFLICEDAMEVASESRDDENDAIATYVLKEVGVTKKSIVYSKY